ncbi:clathrin light chain [Arctopsyche grandis]|uniref:clathrin light chain n=1 Tax=Arctopsyche grandis TaxID=121162 RepID=UPI00406D7499
MDDFGEPLPVAMAEEDAAAAFLARETAHLQGLEEELPHIGEAAPAPAAPAAPIIPFATDEGSPTHFDIDGTTTPPQIVFDAPSPTPMKQIEKEEPEKIRKWREEQKLRLEQKDAEEELRKQEMKEVAKKELEEWYANHEEQISKTKAANRSAEKQFVAESDEMEPGTEWERIAKLCDFNPKSAKSSKDISRMRSIILQLKQTGLTTPKKA